MLCFFAAVVVVTTAVSFVGAAVFSCAAVAGVFTAVAGVFTAVAGVFTAVAGVFTAVAGVFTAVCFDTAAEVRKRTSCDVVVVVNVVVIVAVVVSAGAHTLLVDNACIQSASSSWHNLYSWKLGIHMRLLCPYSEHWWHHTAAVCPSSPQK